MNFPILFPSELSFSDICFIALAVESPVYHRDLSMRSLRIAIKKRLAMDVIDFTKLRYYIDVEIAYS